MLKKAIALGLTVAALGGGIAATAGAAWAGDDNHPHALNPHHK